ncbi:hypothetical protein [Pedobacter hiemivivus]|uniref:DUF4397 domain-containing protein n=1 Tax=Pedobacter hiemivivus TaxID=2530454 RepID=A0A4R0NBZ1_9SPHI|nr:hypothetical protein [Pedobacter hiemivivus]TCC97821.1 hypothetical protein EZ444_07885 [Pedobacter hiemivivus]
MKTLLNIIITCLIMVGFTSCKKQEAYLKETASYAGIPVFINNSILGNKIGTKLNDIPIELYKGIFLSGPGKFTFYNKNTGAVLLEKEFNLEYNLKDTLYLFQPDSAVAPQLIKNTQVNEPAAPAGFFKVKFANLSKQTITSPSGMPYPKIDVIVKCNYINVVTFLPIDTLIAIGSSLDTASYYLVKKPFRSGLIQNQYKFSFLDHDTKQPLLNSSGTLFQGFAALTTSTNPKNVYTVYFADVLRPAANATYILRNGSYYDVSVNKLFEVN